jgi:CubicO group peptidase (beta-lactamase class C family)
MTQPTGTRLSRRTILQVSAASAATLAVSAPPIVSHVAAQSVATPAAGATPAVGATPTADQAALFAELDAFIAQRMAELRVPGVALGIIDGDVEHSAGYGVTNLDYPMPVDAATLFQIGSTTKTVTGTTAMRLVEQGRLDLDAHVRDYLPAFRVADEAASAEVRIRNLVTHTAGWFGDDLSETGDGDDALAVFVERMAALPQLFPVGEYFSYNNAAVDALGRVIEVITGQTYEQAARDLVLTPLGMDACAFFAEEIMTRPFAVGHTASPDDPTGPPVTVAQWAIPRASNPAGGVISTITDQLRYVRFHLGDGTVAGTPVLQPATMAAMQQPMGPGGSLGATVLDGVGVNWLLSTRAGARVVAHGGSTFGQQSAFMLVPERGFGVTVLTNSDSGAVLAEDVANWALGRFLGLTEEVPAGTPVPAAAQGDYVGTYEGGNDLQLVVESTDTGLTLSVLGQSLDLRLVSEDRCVTVLQGLPQLIDFVRDAAGQVGWLRISGRMAPKSA